MTGDEALLASALDHIETNLPASRAGGAATARRVPLGSQFSIFALQRAMRQTPKEQQGEPAMRFAVSD